jgi:hypothetical protein
MGDIYKMKDGGPLRYSFGGDNAAFGEIMVAPPMAELEPIIGQLEDLDFAMPEETPMPGHPAEPMDGPPVPPPPPSTTIVPM